MCGIIGYCGPKPTAEVLLEGLKRLEYRGYDSAGICVAQEKELTIVKKTGKINDLRKVVPPGLKGSHGIGHTRWATHGGVTDANSHPHASPSGDIVVVHNGIIENYEALKRHLMAQGYKFRSETDTEVIAVLMESLYQGSLDRALREALVLLQGTYGLAVVHRQEPGRIMGARNGSPLVIGVGDREMFLASDVSAIVAHTKKVIYLEDGEIVDLRADRYKTTSLNSETINKKIDLITWELEEMEKGGFPHFMLKEIFEQPQSIHRAFQGRLDMDQATAKLGGLNMTSRQLLHVERIKIIAAGTSYHAAQVGAYLLESLARIPCTAELASEVRYRNPIVEKHTVYFAVSQSGETADTLYAMRELQRKGAPVLGICNVVGSSIPRESDGGVYIHSGPEISVASTKAFTSQITVFYLLALMFARMKSSSWTHGREFIEQLNSLGPKLNSILDRKDQLQALAKKYSGAQSFLFMGRGINYPVALEGALKLKEISYIHAEGYSAAEIKHGPIALINEETPSLFLVPNDFLRDKIISNMKEVKARSGPVIVVCEEGDEEVKAIADDYFEVPRVHELFTPYTMVMPLQLFSYYCALELGRDVDQPRNLAKSVTVE